MKNLRMLLTVLAVTLFCLNITAVERMVVRIEEPASSLVKDFIEAGYDIASYVPGVYLDLVVTHKEKAELISLGYQLIVTQTEEMIRNNLQSKTRTIDGYRTYDDVLSELEQITDDYPEITRLYNIGDTWGKIYTDDGNDYYEDYYLDIWALKLTQHPDSLSGKPAVFYLGGHHAREPLSVEVPMDFLNLLLEGYGEDEDITFLIDNTEIWFLPLSNPDGHKVVLDMLDVWWRKNIRDNNENGRFDTSFDYGSGIDGVDVNRNFDFEWRADNRNTRATYPGPAAGSEPEVKVFKELMAEVHFVAGISYHTYGEMVLYPYGYAVGCRAPDHDILKDLSDDMAATIPRLNSDNTYRSWQSLDLYPARGVLDDYAYGKYGIFCYTIEMATEFIPSPEIAAQISEDNMEAAMILLERVHRSTLTGIITDAVTGEPLEAEIYIEEIDETGSFREPYRTRKPFGRYYRMLLPGEYEVIFKSEDYSDSRTYLVTITEDEQTELNVLLFPYGIGDISGQVVDFFDKKPIAGAKIMLTDSAVEPVFTDEEGLFVIKDVPYNDYTLRISAEDFGTLYQHIILTKPEYNLNAVLYPHFFKDTFETLANWETTGSWGLSTQYSYTGDYSLADSPDGFYNANTESFAELRNMIDLTNAENASVTMMARYRFRFNDYCLLQIRTENNDRLSGSGRTEQYPLRNDEWTTIKEFKEQSDWKHYDIPLAAYCGGIVSLRFFFWSDENLTETGIYIDDFRVYISSEELSAEQEPTIPSAFKLEQNFPNPFNAETSIRFNLPNEQHVTLEIFNIAGKKVATLVDEHRGPGSHTIVWEGFDNRQKLVGSGIYFYRLSSEKGSVTRKMVLLK